MVTLPEITWGPLDGPRALLLHGIVGSAATWWRVANALAADGWHVTAVDLRGHGTAPRTDSYAIADYVADLPGSAWDLVLGHSLGGSIAVVAARSAGFTRRLALLDPVLEIPAEVHDAVKLDQLSELTETLEHVRANRLLWHPLDVEYKIEAARQADRRAVDKTFEQNRPWSIEPRVSVPTLVIAASTHSMFTALPGATVVTIDGAGHSPHRDQFDATYAALTGWLTSGGESQP